MKTIQLTVNGRQTVPIAVEPRTQLADFLRDSLNLTGTHLGCEHGVCGACTLMVDGVPARSCITLAVACDGARVTTIEGMNDDEVMAALRAAFTREHALQCGFCTPGMLASAHDVVLRMPDADEQDIRFAMSGNLCRCTGYVGIVRAVQSVIAERKAAGVVEAVSLRNTLGPVGSGHAVAMDGAGVAAAGAAVRSGVPVLPAVTGALATATAAAAATAATATAPAKAAAAAGAAPAAAPPAGDAEARVARTAPAAPGGKALTTLHQSFQVAHPRDEVWAFFGRLGEVTTCLPGASLLAPPTDTHVEPRLRIKVGPIVADFEGAADVERDPATFTGTIFGSARDTRSSSATRGEIRYVLTPEQEGKATRVDIEVGFSLSGPLAQFGRSSIVQDIAQRMTDSFAANLSDRLDHAARGDAGDAPPPAQAAELDAAALMWGVLRQRFMAFFRMVFGRR